MINRSAKYKNRYIHRRDSLSLAALSLDDQDKLARIGVVTHAATDVHEEQEEEYEDDDEDDEEEEEDEHEEAEDEGGSGTDRRGGGGGGREGKTGGGKGGVEDMVSFV